MAVKAFALHQITNAAVPGDAITDQAFMLRKWLREMGYNSDIYSLHYHQSMASEVKLLDKYRPVREERYLIYHHAVGSEIVESLGGYGVPLILIYHNVTPAEFYANVDPALAKELDDGRAQLETVRACTTLGLGDSYYSVLELEQLGYKQTGVLPIALDQTRYALEPNAGLLELYRKKRPLLLFVGRLAPNKRQGDAIKFLHFFRRIYPDSHLALVGSIHHRGYYVWLKQLCETLNLEEAVTFTDHVSHRDMITYYKTADLYLSMSEHEGFGKPLIESMYLELPVMAFASSAVPYTMGDAGVLFHEKDYEALVEMAALIVEDDELRGKLVSGQKRRVRDFLQESVKEQLRQYLQRLDYLPG